MPVSQRLTRTYGRERTPDVANVTMLTVGAASDAEVTEGCGCV